MYFTLYIVEKKVVVVYTVFYFLESFNLLFDLLEHQ